MSRVVLVNPPVLAADSYQVALYAEAIPFGLLQIATALRDAGHEVRFLDMMEYLDGSFESVLTPERLWSRKALGAAPSTAERGVHRLGRPLDWLDERLAELPAVDEVLVTCCLSFNYEPAHAVVRACRERFPRAVIRLGGFYPSQFPDHARSSGADDIHVGRYREAERVFPALDLMDSPPPLWLFRLVLGCRYRCSYCVNSGRSVEVVADPAEVAADVLRVHRQWGIGTFSNWDPNVMLEGAALEAFLDVMVAHGAPVRLKLEMGVQPDLLSPPLLEKMQMAGVVAMTIPFESAEPAMMKRFGKPYRMGASMDAVARCRALGFDTSRFHCTWVVGIRGESYRHLFRTYFGILKAGGLPTPFPLTPTPGTREHELHSVQLADKDLSELNGHLWPTLESEEQAQLYDLVLEIIRQPDPPRASELARDLPRDAAAAFAKEEAWFEEGPHEPG